MGSSFLKDLDSNERHEIELKLHQSQKGNCFICGKTIDLKMHADAIDIDHVEPLKVGGRDDETNFALTHASCNRSKQANDLRVARVLATFSAIKDEAAAENRGPNLNDVFAKHGGSVSELTLRIENDVVSIAMNEMGSSDILKTPLYYDTICGLAYFFVKLPIAYLFHDDRINPRTIGGSITGLVEEFHKKRPQLHVALAWVDMPGTFGKGKIRVFDGQHKASAQVLLGAKELPVRVFVNPDPDLLLTANTNAGTTLRQVAFDKSVQRHLGSALFQDRIERYRRDRGLSADCWSFSERDLINHFKGEWREMRRYVLDAVRDAVSHSSSNKLKDFIEFGGKKGQDRPISYSAIEKTFYSFFIYGDTLETPFDYQIEGGNNPRELEKSQLIRLMNLIAETIFIGNFDASIGVSKLENKVQKGENIPEGHLRAHRMAREEILYNWLGFIRKIVQMNFLSTGKPCREDRSFQYKFPEPLWNNIESYLNSLKKLPLWVNRDLSSSVFGGKQNYDFWHTIFETGKTPQGQQVLAGGGINIVSMIAG